MLRLITFLVAALSALAATTTITGPLNSANGTGYNGYLYISWPTFSSVTGVTIEAGDRLPVKVTNGAFSVALEPSTTRNFVYTVQYQLRTGKINTEWWAIPTASTSVLVDIVRTNIYQYPIATYSLSQLTQGGAVDGQSLVYRVAQGTWVPDVQGVVCTITAATAITCTHNLNSIYVITEVKDATGVTEIPAQVRIATVDSVTLYFDGNFTGTAIIK